MNVKGKVILLTGGARIGMHIAKALGQRGGRVALTWNQSSGPALNTVRHIKAAGGRAAAFKIDLTDTDAIAPLVASVVKTLGSIDVLVHMASIYKPAHFHEPPLEHWKKNINIDLRSAYLLAHSAAPFMQRRGAGRIINFSDWTAASGRPRYKNLAPYYIAKSGLIGLTEVLALELAPHVLVNAIAPGPILPPTGASVREIKEVMQVTPLERWGGPKEIIKAVLFLIDTDFVTGECIRVDGGRHLF